MEKKKKEKKKYDGIADVAQQVRNNDKYFVSAFRYNMDWDPLDFLGYSTK